MNLIICLEIAYIFFPRFLTGRVGRSQFLVFPEEKTCIGKFDWSLPEKEVLRLKVHYEWWAKAGGGPGYASTIEPKEYVKNFVWVKDWINRHFFNKVSDTLLGIIFISFLNFSQNLNSFKNN